MVDSINNCKTCPVDQFHEWFREAQAMDIQLPEAFCLSTVDAKGQPQGRMLLLKDCDTSGFVFYTNLLSPKGEALKANPIASMTFYWEKLRKQVRVFGSTQVVSNEEADAYFHSRPRDSQIGAHASKQSQVLESRAQLENKFKDFEKKFSNQEIPRPDYWTGIRLIPERIEFWIEQPNRLHDRFLYTKNNKGQWDIKRLSP